MLQRLVSLMVNASFIRYVMAMQEEVEAREIRFPEFRGDLFPYAFAPNGENVLCGALAGVPLH